MTFDAELRGYLDRVDRDASFKQSQATHRVDEHALRALLLSRLTELEGSASPATIAATFHEWSPRIGRLARYVERLSNELILSSARTPLEAAGRLLDIAVGLQRADFSLVERLELARILDEFLTDSTSELERYAVETRLVEGTPVERRHLTALGSAFLRLRGRESVRWLLIGELLQSTGPADPWRAPRSLLEAAAEPAGISATLGEHYDYVFPFSRASLERLGRMGVLSEVRDYDAQTFRYHVARDWQDTVEAVLGTGPWHHAIGAILSEDRTGLVPVVQSAAESVVEQAKLIAHEVRNALVPARIRLDALRVVVPEPQADRVEAVRRGVARVLTFVEEMVATSELVAEPVTSCDLLGLLREATSRVDEGERVRVEASFAMLRVRAPRTRLVRSIANVVRNALQATRDDQAVRIAVHTQTDAVRIVVDDAGPGVPDDARERVFQEGYTTRTDGSGYGLAYVRRVVVDGLRGRVWCEPSDLGGARFVIELPETEIER